MVKNTNGLGLVQSLGLWGRLNPTTTMIVSVLEWCVWKGRVATIFLKKVGTKVSRMRHSGHNVRNIHTPIAPSIS